MIETEGSEFEGFNLAKDTESDEHFGLPNPANILCKTCKAIIIPEGVAIKVPKDVNL
jgi:hypothetical protein